MTRQRSYVTLELPTRLPFSRERPPGGELGGSGHKNLTFSPAASPSSPH